MGYDLTLLKNAHTTNTTLLEDGATIQAADIIQDLNLVMNWISYPGRTNSAAAVEDVDFAVAQ